MADSLIQILPKILERGKREAQKILDGLSENNRLSLQINELVLPTKAKGGLSSFFGQSVKTIESINSLNMLIYGDNLFVMQTLLGGDRQLGIPSYRGKIDLIYIDPPFDSKADYRTKIHLPNGDIEQKPTVIEQFAYSDTWKNGTASYLEMIIPRLILMRELLSEQGSIYIHIDWHVGHYVKIIMDELFGKNNFINDIVWKRTSAHNDPNRYGIIDDRILFYTKSDKWIWNDPKIKYEDWYIQRYYKYIDEKTGKRFLSRDITAPSHGRSSGIYEWKGKFPGKGRMWAYTKENMEKLESKGRLFYTENGIPRLKQFLDEMEGSPIQSIWDDILPIVSWSDEGYSFETQKPEMLLKRIIEASTNKDSIVADFFAGSGTTGAVAEDLKRKWIMSDLGKPASLIMRKRLIDQEANPFIYLSVGDYQKEQFEKSSFKTFGDLAQVVINLYGALPFPIQEGIPTNLGYIKQSKILVFADSPSKMTGYNTLKKAQELRASFMGGWNKVVVLGWNFVTDIGRIIESLQDDKLQVLVIPPDLLDRLKTKKNYEQLIKSGNVRFSSLQYITIKPIKKIKHSESEDMLEIELDNYILLSPDALPLDEENKEKLEKIIEKDSISLVEYWSIDPDYDENTFRSKWQDYRENNNDHRIKKIAKINIPKINRKTKVCIKAVDVFGFESATVLEVK